MLKSPILFAVATFATAGAVLVWPTAKSDASPADHTDYQSASLTSGGAGDCLEQPRIRSYQLIDASHILVSQSGPSESFLVSTTSHCHGLYDASEIKIRSAGSSCVAPMDRLLVESRHASPLGCRINSVEKTASYEDAVATVKARLSNSGFDLAGLGRSNTP